MIWPWCCASCSSRSSTSRSCASVISAGCRSACGDRRRGAAECRLDPGGIARLVQRAREAGPLAGRDGARVAFARADHAPQLRTDRVRFQPGQPRAQPVLVQDREQIAVEAERAIEAALDRGCADHARHASRETSTPGPHGRQRFLAHDHRDGTRFLRLRPRLGRPLRCGRAHDRHLLPAVVPGPQAAAEERRVSARRRCGASGRIPSMPSLPARTRHPASRFERSRLRSGRCWPARRTRRSSCAISRSRPMIGAQLAAVRRRIGPTLEGSSPLLERLESQLDEFFAGTRQDFDLPIDIPGSAFQERVWAELRRIPYGETISYRAARRARRRRFGLSRRRPRQRLEPGGGRGSLPPRHRGRRRAGRLRRRARRQAASARARGRSGAS